jgi:hypothetical protein
MAAQFYRALTDRPTLNNVSQMAGSLRSLLVAAALALGGCGSSVETGDAPVSPRTVRSETIARTIYAGQATTLREVATYDFGKRRSRTETYVGDIAELESIVVRIGRVSYTTVLPGTDRWVRSVERDDSAGLSSAAGFHGDPAEILVRLRQQGIADRVLGHETVRGVETTRHAFRFGGFGTAKVIDGVGNEKRDDFVVDVWVDRNGVARRYRWAFGGVVAGDGGGSYRYESTTEYFDFGVPVEILPPAADATVEEWEDLAGES